MLILHLNNYRLLSMNTIELFNIKKAKSKQLYDCHTRFFRIMINKRHRILSKGVFWTNSLIPNKDNTLIYSIVEQEIIETPCIYDIINNINKELTEIYNLFFEHGYSCCISRIKRSNKLANNAETLLYSNIYKINFKQQYSHYIFLEDKHIVILVNIICL